MCEAIGLPPISYAHMTLMSNTWITYGQDIGLSCGHAAVNGQLYCQASLTALQCRLCHHTPWAANVATALPSHTSNIQQDAREVAAVFTLPRILWHSCTR